MSNKEGCPDKTAEVAIANVTMQEKRKRKEKTSGDKGQTLYNSAVSAKERAELYSRGSSTFSSDVVLGRRL